MSVSITAAALRDGVSAVNTYMSRLIHFLVVAVAQPLLPLQLNLGFFHFETELAFMNYPATKLHSRGAEMFSAAGVVRGYYAANRVFPWSFQP